MSLLARAMHHRARIDALVAKIARWRDEREARRSDSTELTTMQAELADAARRMARLRESNRNLRQRLRALRPIPSTPARRVVVARDGTRVHFPA